MTSTIEALQRFGFSENAAYTCLSQANAGDEFSRERVAQALGEIKVHPCDYCGHRYLHTCDATAKDNCALYEWMQTRGSVGRINPVTQEPAETLEARLARLNALAIAASVTPAEIATSAQAVAAAGPNTAEFGDALTRLNAMLKGGKS